MATATTTNLDLPYRPCVGIMLINGDGLVWIGRRLPKWQGTARPTSGRCRKAASRPARTRGRGAARTRGRNSSPLVEPLAEAPGWLTYDLPEELLGIALKGRYRGQRQKWFAMRFTGDDAEIDISARAGHKAEFDDWRWAPAAEIPQLIVSFKRQIYLDVVRTFEAHLA